MKKRADKFNDGRKVLNKERYRATEKNEQYLKYIVFLLLGDYLARLITGLLKFL